MFKYLSASGIVASLSFIVMVILTLIAIFFIPTPFSIKNETGIFYNVYFIISVVLSGFLLVTIIIDSFRMFFNSEKIILLLNILFSLLYLGSTVYLLITFLGYLQ